MKLVQNSSILAQLYELVSGILEIDASAISGTIQRSDVQRWDSLNHLRLITAVEAEFSIQLSMDEIITITSIGRLEDLLHSHLGA